MIDLSVVIVTYKCRDVALDCLRSLYSGGLDGLNAEVFVIDNASGDGIFDDHCFRSDNQSSKIEDHPEMVDDHSRAFDNHSSRTDDHTKTFGNHSSVSDDQPSTTDNHTEISDDRPCALNIIPLDANVGFSAANNIGLARATGRNVLLLNPDTLVPPGALKKCVDFLDEQPETVGGMGCRVVTAEGVTQWECARKLVTPWSECVRALWPFSPPEALPKSELEKTGPVPCLLGAFMLLRKSALDTVGPLDERFFLMYEDVDLCKRFGDAGYFLVYWPKVSITHLGGSSWKQEKIKTFAASHASAIQYLEKLHPRSVRFVRAVVKLGLELRLLALRFRKSDAWSAEHVEMVRAAREALR